MQLRLIDIRIRPMAARTTPQIPVDAATSR